MKSKTNRLGLGCFLVAMVFCAAASAEGTRRSYHVDRAAGAIQIDGVLKEAAWQKSPTFTLDYETNPGDNIAARVKTEMWITYDDSRLYVAVRAHDPQPENIRARFTDRDKANQDDLIGVVLDTFNDERRAFKFFVNPMGVQIDMTQNDMTGSEDDSWDAIWDSAGRITAEGYDAEMAIPFSSLRFPQTDGEQTWGIDALRIYPREVRYRFGLNAIPRMKNCYLCNESKLNGFAGISPGRNMELDPTLTAQDSRQRTDPGTPFGKDQTADPGLTARWGIRPGITLNGAVNPDFSQVEADAAQLTVNTQFAVFYPEKRPLFLEGADFFETRINAIYTRDIADPSWGVKVSGKGGKGVFGAIVARDDRTNFIFPGSQSTGLGSLPSSNTSTILRYRYDIGASSTVGAIATSREGEAGYYNRVLGLDSMIRSGDDAVRVEVLGSMTAYPLSIQHDYGQPAGTLRGTTIRTAYQHSVRSWNTCVIYQGADEDFRADLGFIPQVAYHKGYGFFEAYRYSDKEGKWWQQLTIGADTTWTYDRQGRPLQQQAAPYLIVLGSREFYSRSYLGIGPAYYSGRRFDQNYFTQYVEVRPSGAFFFTADSRVGQEIDYSNAQQGRILRLVPGLRFDLGRHLKLELNHNYERLNVEGGELYHANVTEARTTYQLGTRTFVRFITQFYDIRRNPQLYSFPIGRSDQTLLNQFLFSYKINPQAVLFVGYSDNYGTPPQHDMAQLNRTLFLKLGYAFVL